MWGEGELRRFSPSQDLLSTKDIIIFHAEGRILRVHVNGGGGKLA